MKTNTKKFTKKSFVKKKLKFPIFFVQIDGHFFLSLFHEKSYNCKSSIFQQKVI